MAFQVGLESRARVIVLARSHLKWGNQQEKCKMPQNGQEIYQKRYSLYRFGFAFWFAAKGGI